MIMRAAFRTASSRRFFLAHAQSCLGTGLAYVALPLLAYTRFHSPWAVAAVLVPDLLPAIVLGPLLGALVDRIGWRSCAALADLIRCMAFVLLFRAHSIGWMVAGATLAGVGTALFTPAVLTGLPRLSEPEHRPATMGLFGALDDLGLTVGPAVAGLLLAVTRPETLMGVNAITFAFSAVLVGTLGAGAAVPREADAERPPSLMAQAAAGVRELARRADVRALIASSTAAVVCIGVTNVGEVVLARDVLHAGGSGLAALMTAAGIGTMMGSLAARFSKAWEWRRAYSIGLTCMAADLLICAAFPHLWIVLPSFVLGGFGNGFALVHDRLLLGEAAPEHLHGRLFALQRTCISLAFATSFVTAGALIASGGVQLAFSCAGVGLLVVVAAATPRLRATWPAPVPA